MADLMNEIKKFSNVKIVKLPLFHYYYIENNKVLTKSYSVSDIFLPSTIDYIKKNQNIIFYIYEISETSARWYEEHNKNYIRELRKEKIEKINNTNYDI